MTPAAAATAVPPSLLVYTCTSCTYGVSVRRLPHRCPMCGGHVWRPDPRKD